MVCIISICIAFISRRNLLSENNNDIKLKYENSASYNTSYSLDITKLKIVWKFYHLLKNKKVGLLV